MGSMRKKKILLENINSMVMFLTDEEISEIGQVLLKALNRMEKKLSEEEVVK